MFRILKNLKGNPRICILIEPLWSIPYNLYLPYATVFMYALGIRDAQIGFLLSIGMVFQVAASFAGGVITDKLGRRLTTVIFDITSWSIPLSDMGVYRKFCRICRGSCFKQPLADYK